MLKINDRTTEAVAALLYNNIYDLSSSDEGAWCVEERCDDPAYLAFAESLLQVVHGNSGELDHDIIQHAVQLTDQKHLDGFGWQTIVIDQEYFNLPEKAEEELAEIKGFIVDPSPAYLECGFLDFDQDVE